MAHRSLQTGAALPENPALRQAIARAAEASTPELRTELYQILSAGPVLIALRELPRPSAEADALAGEIAVRFACAPGPAGGRSLAAFSDAAAVTARAPAGVGLAIDPATLLRWAVVEGLDGLVLNPQSPASVTVPRDDLLRILGLADRRRSAGKPLSMSGEPENAIREALSRLQRADAPATVVIVEPRTEKRVEFLQRDDSLMMDVPASNLGRDEIQRARIMFRELAGMGDEGAVEGAEPDRFQAIFSGDVGRAAKAAVKVFTWVFGFPPGFELQIERRPS